MEFLNFFKQKKNVLLLVAITSIVLGALTLILATPFAFGPWVAPVEAGAEDTDRFLAFIAFIGIFVALAEIILGTIICTQKGREKLAIGIPLLVIISSKLLLILVSIIIFGFADISALFFVLGFLLILGMLTGLISVYMFLKEYDPVAAEAAKEARAIERAAREERARVEERERAERLALAPKAVEEETESGEFEETEDESKE